MQNNAAINVEPLLLIPGITAIIWTNPIIKASFQVKSLSFFFPFIFLTKYKNKAVIRKDIPIIFVLFKKFSIWSLNKKPTIPIGITPKIIRMQYLKSFFVSSFLTLKYLKKFIISFFMSL